MLHATFTSPAWVWILISLPIDAGELHQARRPVTFCPAVPQLQTTVPALRLWSKGIRCKIWILTLALPLPLSFTSFLSIHRDGCLGRTTGCRDRNKRFSKRVCTCGFSSTTKFLSPTTLDVKRYVCGGPLIYIFFSGMGVPTPRFLGCPPWPAAGAHFYTCSHTSFLGTWLCGLVSLALTLYFFASRRVLF